jgi:hypothetical protein
METALYINVHRTWTRALKAMDDLLTGVSVDAEESSILLAIASWYIYPKIQIKGTSTTKTFDFKVSLISKDSVLTLG